MGVHIYYIIRVGYISSLSIMWGVLIVCQSCGGGHVYYVNRVGVHIWSVNRVGVHIWYVNRVEEHI